MRRAHKVWAGIAGGVFTLVVIGGLASPTVPTVPAPTATTVAAPAAASSAAPAVAASSPAAAASSPAAAPAPVVRRAAPPAATPRTVTVSRVIDGDTFVADGQKVRVLGIDSCEMSTYGGKQAKTTAEGLLEGLQVTLRTQPGVDRDRYGRQLRYVELSYGADFAESMVVYDHTGVYQGSNDAAKAYIEKLRDADPNGRTCTAPAPAPVTSSDYSDGGGSINWPTPGDQGMPDGALTGGYCKKKWWC